MTPAKKKPKTRCAECGKWFTKNRAWHRWCSPQCGHQHWLRTHPRVKIEINKEG